MYRYSEVRNTLFTEEGLVMFTKVRDFVHKALAVSGAVRMQECMNAAGGGEAWMMLACVDRLVEMGELREVLQVGVCGQHRVFVK